MATGMRTMMKMVKIILLLMIRMVLAEVFGAGACCDAGTENATFVQKTMPAMILKIMIAVMVC